MDFNPANSSQPTEKVSSQSLPSQTPSLEKGKVRRLTDMFEEITQSNVKEQNSDQKITFQASREIPEKNAQTLNKMQSSSLVNDALPYPSHLPPPPKPPTENQEEGPVQAKDKGKEVVKEGSSQEARGSQLRRLSKTSSETIKNYRNKVKEGINFLAPIVQDDNNISLKTDKKGEKFKKNLTDSFPFLEKKNRDKIINGLSVLSQNANATGKDQIMALQDKLNETLKNSETDLFSTNQSEGLAPKDFAKQILKSGNPKRNAYKNLVSDFANKLTNNEMNRLKNAGSIGAIIQEGSPYFKESTGLSFYIAESVLMQDNLENSEKITQFYIDVAKNLEKKGDLSSLSSVLLGLNQNPVSRLFKKMENIQDKDKKYVEKKGEELSTKSKWEKNDKIYSNKKIKTPNFIMLSSSAETARVQVKTLDGQPKNIRKKVAKPLLSLKKRAENFKNLPTSTPPLKMPMVANLTVSVRDDILYDLSEALVP
jgi:hypothetical protein